MASVNFKKFFYISICVLLVICSQSFSQSEGQTATMNEPTLVKRSSEFSKPIYFEPGEGVLFPNQVFDYDLSQDGGHTLRMGNLFINKKNVIFEIKTLDQMNPLLRKFKKLGPSLALVWPLGLFKNPLVEFIGKNGDVIWKKKLSKIDFDGWGKKLDQWREATDKNTSPTATKEFPFNANYVVSEDSSFSEALKKMGQPFRLCLSDKVERTSSRYCSNRAVYRNGKLLFSKVEIKERVIIKNEETVLTNELEVPASVPFSFYADFKSGESYEFIATPSKLNLVDVVKVDNDTIKVIGYGTKPLEKSTVIKKEEYSALIRFFGFESTIKEDRQYWQINLSKDKAFLHFSGIGGAVFKQKIKLGEIPKIVSRIYLHQSTPNSTYMSYVNLKGFKQPETEVSSKENDVKINDNDASNFVWNFKAGKKGEVNKSYLTVTNEGKNYLSFYEIYRSYPNEFSARFTGIVSASGQVVLGEALYTRWFEAMLGENSFSFQRWGLAAKYFNSFNKLKVSETSSEALSVTNLDLKYRLTPGVWTRDETTGVMLSYQDITFGSFKAPMLGGGWFWARSMPRIFDNIFNYFPFMRYPKWVDMEFIYYFNSMSSKITLNGPLSINFHGQILWSKNIFGEAGFGLKRYAFIDKELNQKAELNTFYGTVGLGIKF